MAKKQTRKSLALALPFLGQRPEANVVSENDSAELGCPRKQILVGELSRIVFLRGQNIYTLTAELIADSPWDVDIKIERDRHEINPWSAAVILALASAA